MLTACGGSSNASDAGPTNVLHNDPAALYEPCSTSQGCEEGECTTFENPNASICAAECEADSDCPADGDKSVTCDDGHCRSYVCDDSTPHLSLLGNDLICVRGEVMACSQLSERPCECPCEEVGAICDGESGLCVPAAALGEQCMADRECASEYCAIGQFGGPGFCRLPAGADCNPASATRECDVLCNAVPGAGIGYCLNECEVYCSGSGCSHRCEDPAFTCGTADICRKTCGGDEDCLEWELCEFESITEATGVCMPDPTATPPMGGAGGTGGEGGAGGSGGSGGSAGSGGNAGVGGSTGTDALGEPCTEDLDCDSRLCAESDLGAGMICSVALGEPCLETQDECSYTLEDGRNSICFGRPNPTFPWSTCAWRCGGDLEPCPGGFACASLTQDSTVSGCLDHGTWCMRACELSTDCGGESWTCVEGICQPPDGLMVSADLATGCP